MTLEEFYVDVLPADKNVLVSTIDARKRMVIYALESRDRVVEFLSQYPKRSSYHALGGFDNLPLGRLEEIKGLAPASRVCAWGFDLDVGQSAGKFDTLEEAVNTLGALISNRDIPEPRWIVTTGGGLQFYYVMPGSGGSEAAWLQVFARLRIKLKELFRGKLDAGVATTPHSWLRSPCTPNIKYDHHPMPRLVHKGPLLSRKELTQFLADVKVETVRKTHRDSSSVSVSTRIASPILFEACAAMRQQRDTGGEHTPEPVWAAVANIAAHTLDPMGVFVRCSNKHPDYDEEVAAYKYDHIAQQASAGPWGCNQFGDYKDPESPCYNCWAPRYGLRNPVSAARIWEKHGGEPEELDDKQEPEEDEILPCREIDETRRSTQEQAEDLYVGETAANGDPLSLDEYPWTPAQTAIGMQQYYVLDGELWHGSGKANAKEQHVGTFLIVKPAQFNTSEKRGSCYVGRPGQEKFPIETAKLGTAQACSAALTQLTFRVKDATLMQQYIQGMALDGKEVLEVATYGWQNNFREFFTPNGSVIGPEMYPGEDIFMVGQRWTGQQGDLAGWLNAMSLYNLDSQRPYLMAVLASLAAPLLSYFDLQKGMILSIAGEPGTGKSSANRALNSVWGRPLEQIVQYQSTYVAIRKAIGVCNHLPVSIDEHTNVDAVVLKSLALEISQGQGRSSLTQTRKLRESEAWHTILITTGNNSYHEKLSETPNTSGADMTRVMELTVKPSPDVSMNQGSHMVGELEANHGTMGHAFIEHLMTLNRRREKAAVAKLMETLVSTDKMEGQDRFLRDLIIACYMAHRYAKQVDSRFPGDPGDMLYWMRTQLVRNKQRIVEVLRARIPTPDDFLTEFEADGNILVDNGDGIRSAITSIKGYCFQKGEVVYVPRTLLDVWADRKGVPLRSLISSWARLERLVNLGSAKNPKYTGPCPEVLMINDRRQVPNVVAIRREEEHELKLPTPDNVRDMQRARYKKEKAKLAAGHHR